MCACVVRWKRKGESGACALAVCCKGSGKVDEQPGQCTVYKRGGRPRQGHRVCGVQCDLSIPRQQSAENKESGIRDKQRHLRTKVSVSSKKKAAFPARSRRLLARPVCKLSLGAKNAHAFRPACLLKARHGGQAFWVCLVFFGKLDGKALVGGMVGCRACFRALGTTPSLLLLRAFRLPRLPPPPCIFPKHFVVPTNHDSAVILRHFLWF